VQRNALADLVAPTVDEEECAFLGAQNTRATTIEMAEKPVAEDDGIPWRDRPRALRAPRGLLFRHWSIPNAKGAGWLTPGARRQLASPRVLQVVGERERSTWSPRCSIPSLEPRRRYICGEVLARPILWGELG